MHMYAWVYTYNVNTHTYKQDFISLLQIVVDSNGTLDDIYPLAEKICVLILKEAAGRVICPGFIRSYGPPVRLAARLC